MVRYSIYVCRGGNFILNNSVDTIFCAQEKSCISFVSIGS